MLNQTQDKRAQVKYAVCQMSLSNSLETCASQAGLSSDIESCMNSQLGTLLQLEAERITHSYQPSFVPTIIFNGVSYPFIHIMISFAIKFNLIVSDYFGNLRNV